MGAYAFIVISIWPIGQRFLLIQIILYFADFSICFAALSYTLKMVVFFYKLFPLVCYAWRLHLKEITQKAFRLPIKTIVVAVVDEKSRRKLFRLKKFHPNSQNSHSITSLSIKTAHFMREHTKLLVALVHLNQHLASVLIFWYYFSMLYFSIFILCLLYFLQVSPFIKAYYGVINALVIGSFAYLLSLSAVIKVLYSCGAAEKLYRVQMSCGGKVEGILQFKLKLMSYYEVLRTKKRVTFTFGHHAPVNNKWLLEVKKMRE